MGKEKVFVYVGKWEHDASGKDLGFDIFSYDEQTAKMEYVSKAAIDLMVGAAFVNKKNGVLYASHEAATLPGFMTGGGGMVVALKIDPETGEMTELNRLPSFGVRTSYSMTDMNGEYLIATNHSGRAAVTKVVKDAYNKYHVALEFDDSTTVLYPLNDDGSIADPVDVFMHKELGALPGQNNPHPHSVQMSPDGNLFAVCDKGGDRVYFFKIDREKNRLMPCGDKGYHSLPGSSPRYSVFHPTKPYFYVNNETKPIISAFSYDEEGRLTLIDNLDISSDDMSLTEKERKGVEASDIRIHPNGKYIYNIVRGNKTNAVYVLAVDEKTGKITRIQSELLPQPAEGKDISRGCAVSPDGKVLLVAMMGSGNVLAYSIKEDGTLSSMGAVAEGIYNPANVTFFKA